MRPGHISKPYPAHLPAVVLVVAALASTSAQAAVTATGDVSPAPATWGGLADIMIGNTDDGSVTVDAGSGFGGIGATNIAIGYTPGVTGRVSVQGPSSTLNAGGSAVTIGGGTGIIDVTTGAAFSSGNILIGRNGGTGILNVTGSGSSMNVEAQIRVGDGGTGRVTVADGGTLNISHSAPGFWIADDSDGSIVVDGAGSAWHTDGNLSLILGSTAAAAGTFSVTHGGAATISGGFNFETGVTTLDGPGSSLDVGDYLRVWSARMNILNGASVAAGTDGSQTDSVIGFLRQAGTAIVDGAGSQWTNANTLYVGNTGGSIPGYLSISDGGTVAAQTVSVNALSSLSADMGSGSALDIGNGVGTLTNNGSIRLAAGAGAASGSYTPMAYGTMTGTGTVQALGGRWDAAAHTVTVSEAATALAGETATLDLSTTQRLLVTDAASGDQVGLGFKGASTPTILSFSATEATGAEQSVLQGLLAPGQSVLSAWDFTPGAGYASGDPAYLSMLIGSGFKLSDLAIWHFDGTAWSLFNTNDLAYDNQFASFTATGFSGYAVVGPSAVPVPAAVWLFGSALAGMVGFSRLKGMASAASLA